MYYHVVYGQKYLGKKAWQKDEVITVGEYIIGKVSRKGKCTSLLKSRGVLPQKLPTGWLVFAGLRSASEKTWV